MVGSYIADFYSRSAKLVIEVDADSHAFQHDYVQIREAYFRSLGFSVIRFTNFDVMTNVDGVLQSIAALLHSPLPTLCPEGERAL